MSLRRRDFLAGALGTGMGVAAGEVYAGSDYHQLSVEHTGELRKLKIPRDRRIIVSLLGYGFPGDGGGKMMYWDPWSRQADNKGTVIAPESRKVGRWLQLHQGELDFRHFGIFSGEYPADDALDAMISDPMVHTIRASTDLNFIRRHQFTRSGITLNFGNQTVTAAGIEDADRLAPYLSAILKFTGSVTGDTLTVQLREQVPELSDIYPTHDNRAFTIGNWYRLESGKLKGQSERIVQRLVMVTERIGEENVRVNYKTGYTLPAGESLSWTPVSPVKDVNITNMVFNGASAFASNGAHPLALEYAVNCNVRNIHSSGTFWPVIFRRWNTGYRTEQCSLINPPTTHYGGAGYLTQQIYCLYGHVSDCSAANARHLNDFTASSYCLVQNCHATGDSAGAFTTHGQYEHDLVYQGNSGIMSLANSGYQWGLSARRIRIEKHVCTMLLANTFTSDVSLVDVHILRASNPPDSGVLRLNTDGLHMQSCQVDGELTLVSYTSNSLRSNLIEGCGFRMDNRHDLTISDLDDRDPYIASHPPAVFRNSINGSSALTFAHCHFEGSDNEASWWLGGKEVHFSSCKFEDLCLQLNGEQPQKIVFTGNNAIAGPGWPVPLISQRGEQAVTWKISDLSSYVSTPSGTHIAIDSGENAAVISSSEFSKGRCTFAENAFRQSPRQVAENNLFLAGCKLVWQDTRSRPRADNPDDDGASPGK